MNTLASYSCGNWFVASQNTQPLVHAVTGEQVASISSAGLDVGEMMRYGRKTGGAALRKLTFHDRARMLKALAQKLMSQKDEFYAISAWTGATKLDSWIDIEGGIGTLFVYASKGRREFPNESFFVDGAPENLSKTGTFIGRHICVPLEGVAIHINAFNFPVWGMLEKLAPSFLAGVPCIIKPASATAYLTEAVVKAIIESKILPEGALQLVCGSLNDGFNHLTCQDVVTFTGSATTGRMLKSRKEVIDNSVRFTMEADSLNCSILGPDAAPGTDEFQLFIKEVAREMTVKAGQKCTAIRRTIVPDSMVGDVLEALTKRLKSVVVGDPSVEGVTMGPLAAKAQVKEVGACVSALTEEAQLVFKGDLSSTATAQGAFHPITLLHSTQGLKAKAPHDIEAFGPVNTVLSYRNLDEAIELARLGKGSLVGSLFTNDDQVATSVAMGVAPYHGRLLMVNRHCAKESTGHGSPMPHLIHGGPGRAGGGEEMGGARGVMHYLQRAALQGSPTTLQAVTRQFSKGAQATHSDVHPFRKYFEDLVIGEQLLTHRRTITESDIVNFAGISGDFFYAHMDDIAAKESIFERRVAHGYFVIAAAAGLFVDPAPGPVLANYGLEGLRFVKPVYVGDTIRVRLTCKQKTAKEVPDDQPRQGVVAWDVEVENQAQELVATYTVLTLVRRR